MTTNPLEGRVAVVTGGGRGLGRAHALELARKGAKVVVNDLGVALNGEPEALNAATSVVHQICEAGGEAVRNTEDVSDLAGAARMVSAAISSFGRLDVIVNNAGIIRDRMLVNVTEEDWDAVIRVHLKGTFAPIQAAARHWRELSKNGLEVDARIINTTSGSGLYGNIGQANYGAAKAGIAALTVIAAIELERYGVTVNAVAPGARTRMTDNPNRTKPSPFAPDPAAEFDHGAPENVSPLVAWLASPMAKGVTGRVFNIHGGSLSVAEGWHAGEILEKRSRWTLDELDTAVPELLAKSQGRADMEGKVEHKEGRDDH